MEEELEEQEEVKWSKWIETIFLIISLHCKKVKIKEKKLLRGLCPSRSCNGYYPGTMICLNSSTAINYINYKMYYKSVIIHKKRIFPYYQNK